LKPKVSGTACCRLLRPAIGVSRIAPRQIGERRGDRLHVLLDQVERGADLQDRAVSVMSCVVAPQWHHSPSPSAQRSTICCTTPRIG
jgi:hypothetical protein